MSPIATRIESIPPRGAAPQASRANLWLNSGPGRWMTSCWHARTWRPPFRSSGCGAPCLIRDTDSLRGVRATNTHLDDAASPGKHADTAVLQLSLTEPLDVNVAAEAEGVETHIASHRPVKALGLAQERHGLGLASLVGNHGLHLHACQHKNNITSTPVAASCRDICTACLHHH